MNKRIKTSILSITSVVALGVTAVAADGQKVEPDNTEKNERDRSGETKTAGDQSNKPDDIKVTQTIRRAVMDDDSLSMTAKNVKIITADGQVTLRGPVKTAEEKSKIEAHAKAGAGGAKVDSQLEVDTEEKEKDEE